MRVPTSPPAVMSISPDPPAALLKLRGELRQVLALIGYGVAAGLGTDEQVLRHDLSLDFPDETTKDRLAQLSAALERIAEEAETAAVEAVCKHVLLPDPPVTS